MDIANPWTASTVRPPPPPYQTGHKLLDKYLLDVLAEVHALIWHWTLGLDNERTFDCDFNYKLCKRVTPHDDGRHSAPHLAFIDWRAHEHAGSECVACLLGWRPSDHQFPILQIDGLKNNYRLTKNRGLSLFYWTLLQAAVTFDFFLSHIMLPKLF